MRKGLRITVPGKCKEEAASHDVGRNNVTWSIRIYRRTSIEKCYANFRRVYNNYWLASYVEVDEIACRDKFRYGGKDDR
jgi:hypothetical protein